MDYFAGQDEARIRGMGGEWRRNITVRPGESCEVVRTGKR
jgi:hypothetical protein